MTILVCLPIWSLGSWLAQPLGSQLGQRVSGLCSDQLAIPLCHGPLTGGKKDGTRKSPEGRQPLISTALAQFQPVGAEHPRHRRKGKYIRM